VLSTAHLVRQRSPASRTTLASNSTCSCRTFSSITSRLQNYKPHSFASGTSWAQKSTAFIMYFIRSFSAALDLLNPPQSVVASTAVSDTLIDSLQMSVELAGLSNVRQQEVHERFEDMVVAIDELGDFFGALRFWKVVLCSGVSFLVVVGAGASLGECSSTTTLS
jgi:hypothetical protein